jgi:hypothetical protein
MDGLIVAPAVNTNGLATGSTLIADTGTRLVKRSDLAIIPTPPATRTHRPVSHYELAEAIIDTLKFRHLNVVKDEYAVSFDGMKMFGLMEIDVEWSGNDRSMKLALAVGYRIFCCSNMMFKGDYFPLLARHSNSFNLIEQVSIGVDRIQRNFAPLNEQIELWSARQLSDDDARVILYKAFLEKGIPVPLKLLKDTHNHYFNPQYEEFAPRTLFSLSNAFTSAFKLLDPLKAYPATSKLAGFLTQFE